MSLHDFRNIRKRTQSFLDCVDEIISDLEKPAISTHSLFQPTNPKNDVRTSSGNHGPDAGQLYATLAGIISEASRLQSLLKPGGNAVSPKAPDATLDAPSRVTRSLAVQHETASVQAETPTPVASQPANLPDTSFCEQTTAGFVGRRDGLKVAIAPASSDLPSRAATEVQRTAIATATDHAIPPTLPCQTRKIGSLRFACKADDLGENMVPSISKAIAALGEEHVMEYGYLVFDVGTPPVVDWAEVSRGAPKPQGDEIRSFCFSTGAQGVAHSYRSAQQLEFNLPDFSVPGPLPHLDPEQNFENAVIQPPDGDLAYYVGVPFFSLACTDLVHPGDKLIQRGNGSLPGINTPYWYISTCRGTPANLHVEDARTGSVNFLLTGAPKDWLFIHQRSTSKLETCLRNEFPNCKPCSQFARHLNILLSPSWLRERAIEYSVVRQDPGQMICTLAGTYHQVQNSGKNFAVSINFELDQWPDEPADYTWCRSGARSCGLHALTKADFQLPLSHQCRRSSGSLQSTPRSPASEPSVVDSDIIDKRIDHMLDNIIEQTSKERQGATDNVADRLPDETIVIDEMPDETNSHDETMEITHLPLEAPDASQDIENVIRFCLAKRLSPDLLGCRSVEDMQRRLKRFSPGMHIDDALLRMLLQIICSGHRFVVVESLSLDISRPRVPNVELHLDTRGLVFPFNVNDREQSSPTAPKNHWVLGIFDRHLMRFISFGIDAPLAARWASALETGMRDFEEEPEIQARSGTLPSNPDNASCALVCCLALEKYLGLYPSGTEPPSLRSHYLRKLLSAIVFSSQHKELTGNSSRDLVLLSSSYLLDDSCLDATISSTATTSSETLLIDLASFPNKQLSHHLRDALLDEGCQLALEEKARILQMIMQCSNDVLKPIGRHLQPASQSQDTAVEALQDFCNTMRTLVEKIDRVKEEFHLPMIQQRMLYIQLAKTFTCEVKFEEERMRRDRQMRKRMHAQGMKLPRNKKSGKTAKGRVLDRLIQASTEKSSKTLKSRLAIYTRLGSNLEYLSSKLGTGLLLTLPVDTVEICDLHLPFPLAKHTFPSLAKAIEASAYNHLENDRASYFVKWFPGLRKELMAFTSLNYQLFLPSAQFNWKEGSNALLAIQNASSSGGVFKRPFGDTVAIVRKRKKKEPSCS